MKLTSWLCALACPLLCAAAEIPEPVLPAGVGVNIHFVTGHENDLDMIAAAGFKFIRMDFHWAGIEKEKGHYDWSGYEELLRNLDQRGLRAILILDYSHGLYEETVTSPNPLYGTAQKSTASPQHPESIAAYARWAAASAKHFQGRHVLWEIWNEPNGNFWAPKPDAQQYTALALAASKAIRQAEPQATIIGPASSGFPWEFLITFLKSGVLDYLDAVSVHPYRSPQTPPETAAADYQKLRRIIDTCAPESKKGRLPIVSGEWGYSTFTKGVALPQQADFAVRQQLVNLLNDVPLSIWYDWKNDGNNPNENEDNFGTVQSDLKPKPTYLAIQKMTQQLTGYRIAQRLPLPDEKDYTLLCTNAAGSRKLVAWTIGEPHTAVMPGALNRGKPGTDASLEGAASTAKSESKQSMLELTPTPQYVSGPVGF